MNGEENKGNVATPVDPSKYDSVYERKRTEIMEGIVPCAQSGLALDIGCGSGHYTKILMEKGWRTTAIDADNRNIELAKDYASEAFMGDATAVLRRFSANHYDLALMLEIVEHMAKRDARTVLEEVYRVLRQEGRLILSTPNRLSLEGLGGYYWGERIRGRGKWNAWDPTHVHIYTSFEIIGLLKECGFGIERIMGYWYEAYFPPMGRWKLPLLVSKRWLFNRFGYIVILECCRK